MLTDAAAMGRCKFVKRVTPEEHVRTLDFTTPLKSRPYPLVDSREKKRESKPTETQVIRCLSTAAVSRQKYIKAQKFV